MDMVLAALQLEYRIALTRGDHLVDTGELE
jgi:hypothetical protein